MAVVTISLLWTSNTLLGFSTSFLFFPFLFFFFANTLPTGLLLCFFLFRRIHLFLLLVSSRFSLPFALIFSFFVFFPPDIFPNTPPLLFFPTQPLP